MGGMIAVTVRNKDKTIKSFKTHTGFISRVLDNANILHEDWMIKIIKDHDLLKDEARDDGFHTNYDSDKGVKAPYHYGLILIDYATNKIISANNYDALLTGSSAKLLDQYHIGIGQKFKIATRDHKSRLINEKNMLEEKIESLGGELCVLNTCLKNNAIVKYKAQELKSNTIEGVVQEIYGIELVGLPIEVQKENIRIYNNKCDENGELVFTSMSLNDYSDIEFIFPVFGEIENYSNDGCTLILDYMKKNDFILSEYENQIWSEFIAEKLEEENERKNTNKL